MKMMVLLLFVGLMRYNITVTFMPAVDSLVACFCGQSDGLLTLAMYTPGLDMAGGGHFSPMRLLPGLAAQ